MIRVGFVLSGSSWMGGVNYYRNLLGAIAGSRQIEPVIFTGDTQEQDIMTDLPGIPVIRSSLVHPSSLTCTARKVSARLLDRDLAMEYLLRRHKIDVLSHAAHLGRRSTVPTVCWIPDFQHIRLPNFFACAERRRRDRSFRRSADACTRLILSSEDARKDLAAFRPSAFHKARVLRFVSAVGCSLGKAEARDRLMRRYDLNRPFFHLPNQFWAHKNHVVVIEALALARSRGHPLCVVATGHTHDYRDPPHFERLVCRVREAGCAEDFRILGLVPYADLASLMRHSIALINPSLFEGWSTTVEEAKSLGKTIMLSDIPVHREQAPDHGVYFDPHEPEDLLLRLFEVSDAYDESKDQARWLVARADLPRRLTAFGETFEGIVTEAAAS